MITIRPYDSGQKKRWNQFVQTARNPHFMFDRGYMDYHSDRFSDASLMFETGKGLVAVLPAHHKMDATTGEHVLSSHEGLSFGGLIVGTGMHQKLMDAVFKAVPGYLRERGFQKFRYEAMPSIYSLYPGEEDLWCLHRLGALTKEIKVASVLRAGEPPSTSQAFRRQVRKALVSNIEIDWSEDVEGFHDLLSLWLNERYQASPVHTVAELRLLRDRFPERIRFLAAKCHSKLVAAQMIFQTETCLRLQYVANTAEGMDWGAAQLLIQRLLESLPPGKWMDFGTSMASSGELQDSLHSFKESCGARTLLQKTYELAVESRE